MLKDRDVTLAAAGVEGAGGADLLSEAEASFGKLPDPLPTGCKFNTVASPLVCPTTTRFSCTGCQSNARKAGTLGPETATGWYWTLLRLGFCVI